MKSPSYEYKENKTINVNARAIIVTLTALLALTTSLKATEPTADFEKFTRSGVGRPMSIETQQYIFNLSAESEDSYVIEGSLKIGDKIKHVIDDGSFYNAERMFALESYGCNGTSIDLIIQIGPPRSADIIKRNYYRIIFEKDLTTVISEFYDPSVSAANAVLPVQSVEGILDLETEKMVTCDGTTPVITEG